MKNIIAVLCLTLIFASCKKDAAPPPPVVPTTPYYFMASVNGSTVKYEANDIDTRYACGISQPSNGLVPSDYDIYEGTIIMDEVELSKNAISVHVLKYFDHYPSESEKIAMVNLGSYAYGFGDVSSSTINGASIQYLDANGAWWDSEWGPQTGSTFNIAELIPNTDGTSGKIFKATFSCKLYDGSGGSIQISNATIRGKILSP